MHFAKYTSDIYENAPNMLMIVMCTHCSFTSKGEIQRPLSKLPVWFLMSANFLYRSIRQHLREEGIDSLPLVVHCATGSGASGAFVLAEIMLTLIEHEEVIDVQRVLTFLRYQRPAMVDNYLYYEFVYRVLIQSLALVRLI